MMGDNAPRKQIDAEMASCYSLNGDYEQAIALYSGVLEQDPNNDAILNNLAICYARIGEYDRSLALQTQALRHNPHNPELLTNIATTYFRQRNYIQALQVIDRAAEQIRSREGENSAAYAAALVNKAACLAMMDYADDALTINQQALQIQQSTLGAEHITVATTLNNIADSLLCSSPQEALKLKLVDKLAYSDEAEQLLKSKMNLGSDDKINYVSVSQYVKSLPQKKNYSSNKVAVMYAFGEISDGKGDSGRGIYSDTFVKDFRKVYKDKDVKAIVLRVNSPGGSALASENIWHEIELAKKAGKKIVVSMGDYAASGGYYISCNADYIIAEPNTITGSIGVFGMIPTVQNFLKNKIGITVDEVGTNKHSDFGSLYRPLDALESERVQASIEEIYGTFTKRVADGRHLDVAYVDSIGQGRVWAGSDALKLGLVDKMGNINDAIAKAAELAQLEGFDVCYYPEKKDWFSMIFSMKDDAVDAAVRQKMGIYYQLFNDMQQVLENEGVQARMPMTITIQ